MDNFEKYDNVFCDSKEALEWLYNNGLSKNAIIRTSSPALLLDKNKYNIEHVEKRWSVSEFKRYQTSINKFIKNIYSAVRSIDGISHERALAVSIAIMTFHNKLFKAACLTESDLVNPRLIVQVDGNGGLGGNNMNAPWDALLSVNQNIKTIRYNLKSDKWSGLSVKKLSWIQRYKIAGIETLIFRIAVKIWKYIPNILIRKEVLIPSENELVIETAAHLALKKVSLKTDLPTYVENNINENISIEDIWLVIRPIIRIRLREWVLNDLIETCERMMFDSILKKLEEIKYWKNKFDPYFKNRNIFKKTVVLSNTLVNNRGIAISECCIENKIPIVSAQHGVTYEICETHNVASVIHEINLANKLITYSDKAKVCAENSGFNRGNAYTVGISSRHRRIKLNNTIKNYTLPIVFVSTNLYKGNLGFFSTWHTDFDRAKKECALIERVFSKLPHALRYKAYPEENRRYSDSDPVFKLVELCKNIELYDAKIDMRYLIRQHRVFVTTKATSTLSWLVMSGKPVVFINAKNNMPLTADAHKYFSKGLFLFNDDEDDFYSNIKKFLSQPIEIIENQWAKKEKDRALMIKRFFSSFPSGAGHRAADMIYSDYLK